MKATASIYLAVQRDPIFVAVACNIPELARHEPKSEPPCPVRVSYHASAYKRLLIWATSFTPNRRRSGTYRSR